MRMMDGHATLVTFELNFNVMLWEKTVTPPGREGGGAIAVDTMRNTRYLVQHPKKLVKLSDMTITASWDPRFYTDIVTLQNILQWIIVRFPNGRDYAFHGWLDTFKPNEHRHGEMPTAEVTIIPSMMAFNPLNPLPVGPDFVEEDPRLSATDAGFLPGDLAVTEYPNSVATPPNLFP